ncbi:hypothetical protein Tco_0583008 [Tanacetum coccineum]
MANLSEDIQCAGSDTRPPMLDRTDFASWKQHIRLYCRGKENGVNILKSIDEGPFQMGTFQETLTEGTEGAPNLGPERPRVYSDLSPKDKERYNADIRATNILLQVLPKDIYSLINHYTDAKDIWDNVKMLLEGSELTKEDRESQLYDDFEHFLKLKQRVEGLNKVQQYAYLKQHKAHTNENKMMMDRFTQHIVDPLALMSNGQQNRGQGNNAWGGGATGYGGAQNRAGNDESSSKQGTLKCSNCNVSYSHISINCTHTQASTNSEYFNDKDVCMMKSSENREHWMKSNLLFIAAFDSDVDEAPMAHTIFMANLSIAYLVYDKDDPSYNSDILSKGNNPHLDTNHISERNHDASNVGYDQENQEHKDNLTPDPSNCKIRRFKMMKYSFNDDEEYITIKESEHLYHLKKSLDAYQELLRLINEGWVVTTPDE